MSIQTIIDGATNISINRRAIAAQTISRSNRIKTAERGDRVWQFDIAPPPGLKYETNRDLLEELDRVDRILPETVSFSNNPNMTWITEYKGELTPTQLADLEISSVGSNTITLTSLPPVSSATVMFAKGDYIQPVGSAYAYTITSEVVRGGNSTVVVNLHRGLLDTPSAGTNINTGDSITFYVQALSMPTYSITPGRFIAFNGDLQLMEVLP
jgi:hypothetical protein